ncbi:MAG: IclR family transcriptional regulator [Treponema sp.]|jgi:DNA-binding IclR family transcriptional regulator|nr:IclR family transcriptional regulator [Treponema sp.]
MEHEKGTSTSKSKNSAGIKKNQSLRKALHILEGMTRIHTPARLQDIAQSLKMPQSTVLRFLNTYSDFGYVRQDPTTSCYYLTLKLTELGFRAKDNFPFPHSLLKYIKQIAGTFNESSSLCVEQNMQMVYVAIEEGTDRMLQTLQRIGRIAPMHATGVGKLHLMNYSEAQLGKLEQKYGFPQYTAHTISTMDALKTEIERIKYQGYAVDNEECEAGVRCIAVPVRDYTGKVVAGISMSAPVTRLDMHKLSEIAEYFKAISQEASEELGWDSHVTV